MTASAAVTHSIRTIRDLINEPVIRGELIRDSGLWDRVCTAMDCLTDSGHLPDRVDAVNVLAGVAGESALTGDVTESDVRDAMQRVGVGLERRKRRGHKGLSARPLEEAFRTFKGLDYAMEKVGGVTRSRSDMLMCKASLGSLEELVISTRDGLNARGLWGSEMTSDLELILARLKAYVDGAPDAPRADDMDLIARHAFKKLMDELRDAAREADSEDSAH